MKKKVKSLFEMRHFLKKAGKVPGELESEKTAYEPASVELIRFHKDHFDHEAIKETGELNASLDTSTCNWINVLGLNDIQTIQNLGNAFDIHSLTLEDIINTDHLPKCEISEDHLFFTLKYPIYDYQKDTLELRHISLILSNHYLITLQEGREDLLTAIRERIKNSKGKVRQKNIEYLSYIIIDYIVDQYFYLMDTIRDHIEATEDLLIDEPEENHIQKIHLIKKQIVYLRKYITSLNKAVNALLNNEMSFLDENVKIYIRDVYDHTIHINESLMTSKELQTTLLEMNMANVSNSMNRVMKTLTIVASIFIPLTFVAGIYGMNFQYMPELQWKYGYPAVLGAMTAIALVMLVYMRRKKWF
ncbi:MAG: magnesium/cobalt transporter CorA [Bacteroidales bacterium]|nr:magnesium/cobalt transporter CorA [Bacteroidales bacterium]